MLIMVCGLQPISVFADNTAQNVPDIGSDFYSDTVTTRLDDTVAVTADTYYQNAISPTIQTPSLPTIVKQSQSTTTLYDFAAGLPLSTIFIDETKIGPFLGTFALEPNENRDYTGLITRNTDNVVSYDPGWTAERHLLNGEATVLEGPLFSFTFKDAAILPNGSRANLKITYSNARIFTDERLKAMEDVAKEHLATAQAQMEAASTPAEIAAAQKALDAANTELLASYYHGGVEMAQGNNIRHNGSDPRNLTKTNSGFSRAQINAAKAAIEARIDKYKIGAGLSDLVYNVTQGPSLGKSVDTTYEIVDDDGNPIDGTFIFVNVGISLDRDPYTLGSHNSNKGLWWVQDVDPNLHFLSEQIAVANNSIASDYIYVRPNNDKIEDLLPGDSREDSRRIRFNPQVVEATEDGVKKTKFISNCFTPPSGTPLNGADGYYLTGFVTLARSGFTVTAYGHGFSGGNGQFGPMNAQAYGARRIWYRYTSSTGPNGNIQTTSEGNFGGGLNDASDAGKSADILDPGTYVVPEGKTVTYTMTPNTGYHISKLQVRNEDGDMQEIRFDGKPLYTMVEGDTVQFRDAAGQLCTLTALADGKFKLEMPYALHDEKVHVQWAKIPLGSLTVKKTVKGDLADKDQYFNFTITFDAEGSYSYTGSKSGTIKSGDTVQLKHGKRITISGLPAGTTYSVTESGNEGYSVYASGDKGTIAANETSTAAFTNSKIIVPQTGDDSNLLLWLGIAGVSGLGMLLTAILGKKRKGKHSPPAR